MTMQSFITGSARPVGGMTMLPDEEMEYDEQGNPISKNGRLAPSTPSQQPSFADWLTRGQGMGTPGSASGASGTSPTPMPSVPSQPMASSGIFAPTPAYPPAPPKMTGRSTVGGSYSSLLGPNSDIDNTTPDAPNSAKSPAQMPAPPPAAPAAPPMPTDPSQMSNEALLPLINNDPTLLLKLGAGRLAGPGGFNAETINLFIKNLTSRGDFGSNPEVQKLAHDLWLLSGNAGNTVGDEPVPPAAPAAPQNPATPPVALQPNPASPAHNPMPATGDPANYDLIAKNNPDIINAGKKDHPDWTNKQIIDDWFNNTKEAWPGGLDDVAKRRNNPGTAAAPPAGTPTPQPAPGTPGASPTPGSPSSGGASTPVVPPVTPGLGSAGKSAHEFTRGDQSGSLNDILSRGFQLPKEQIAGTTFNFEQDPRLAITNMLEEMGLRTDTGSPFVRNLIQSLMAQTNGIRTAHELTGGDNTASGIISDLQSALKGNGTDVGMTPELISQLDRALSSTSDDKSLAPQGGDAYANYQGLLTRLRGSASTSPESGARAIFDLLADSRTGKRGLGAGSSISNNSALREATFQQLYGDWQRSLASQGHSANQSFLNFMNNKVQ